MSVSRPALRYGLMSAVCISWPLYCSTTASRPAAVQLTSRRPGKRRTCDSPLFSVECDWGCGTVAAGLKRGSDIAKRVCHTTMFARYIFLKLSIAYEKFYVLEVNHSSFLRTKNGKCVRKCTNGPSCLCTFAVILIVILIIIGIPSPTHSFTLGLNPSFSANPPYCSLFFFSFRFHYMDFPDCLLLLLSISVFLLFLFLHFFSCRFRAVD